MNRGKSLAKLPLLHSEKRKPSTVGTYEKIILIELQKEQYTLSIVHKRVFYSAFYDLSHINMESDFNFAGR